MKNKRQFSIVATGTNTQVLSFAASLDKLGYRRRYSSQSLLSSTPLQSKCIVTYTDNTYDYYLKADPKLGTPKSKRFLNLSKDKTTALEEAAIWAKPTAIKKKKPTTFKAGDYVVVLKTDLFYYNAEQGKAQRINVVHDRSFNLYFRDGSTNSYSKVRKATPSEIAETKKITCGNVTIADRVSNYSVPGRVSFGCNTYTKEDVASVRKLISVSNAEIKIRGTLITLDMLNKIYRSIK